MACSSLRAGVQYPAEDFDQRQDGDGIFQEMVLTEPYAHACLNLVALIADERRSSTLIRTRLDVRRDLKMSTRQKSNSSENNA